MKMFLMVVFLFATSFLVGYSASAYSGAGGQEFVQEYEYSYAVHGGSTGFKNLYNPKNALPSGAIVQRVLYKVVTAPTSAGSATIAIGDAASNDRYLSATANDGGAFDADDVAVQSSGLPNLISSANEGQVGILIGAAALTAGKIKVIVQGYVPKQ